MYHRRSLYSNADRLCKLIVDIVSGILDGHGDTALAPCDHRDRLAGIAAEREQECVQLLIVGDDALDDIFLPKQRIGQVHKYTSFRFGVSIS